MALRRSNFIKPINFQGGTFYTFQSAIEDFNVSLNDATRKVSFSNYALLNIPNIETPTNKLNTIQFDSIDGSFLEISGDNNRDLAESFQNYCLNLETTIISQPTYKSDALLNVSERVFFKWLKEIGAIRYRNATSLESTLNNNTFVEEDVSLIGNQQYNRVVQHIGTIDVKNAIKNTNNTYSEVYIRVGATEGNTPVILFKTVEDDNYKPNMVLRNLTNQPANKEVLFGRDFNEQHPTGLSIQAFYDNDGISTKTLNGNLNNAWYGTTSETNLYFTEPNTFQSVLNDEINLDDPNSSKNIDTFRSRLDGVMLDFDPNSYKIISDSNVINRISQMNSINLSQSFEFNAVLVYYNVTDGSISEDNLYGILFLDDVKNISGGGGEINRFQKIKANSIANSNGNSYGLKLNLKYDTSVDNVGVEISVSEDANVSMEMFTTAITRLYKTIEIFENQNNILLDFNTRIKDIESLILSSNDLQTIIPRVEQLETTINNLGLLQQNSDEIKQLITNLSNELLLIMNNQTSINVSYNTDIIRDGDGIKIDRSANNILRINSTNQKYNIVDPLFDISSNLVWNFELQKFTNYKKHYNINTITLTDNIVVNINENINIWNLGQTFRFVIGTNITFDGFAIKIVLNDRNSNEIYSYIINEIGFNESKIIEFICIDSQTKSFIVDVIK